MNVAAYTPGILDASSRARVRQFVEPLGKLDIVVTEYSSPCTSTMPVKTLDFPGWAAATVGSRLVSLAAGRSADVSWVLRQLLPAYLSVESLVKKPMILDVDDAIWLNRGGHRVPGLARSAQVVVCGNRFLAARFSEWNSNIVVIPTAVDTHRYEPGNVAGDGPDGVVIGWTGASGNFPYLYAVEDALAVILNRYHNCRVLVVADRAPQFSKLPKTQVEFTPWTPDTERSAVARMSIGLMPLADSEWTRGKCSYKMLCYMAASLPVVVSPVGMNNEVLAQGTIGYGASNTDEWIGALTQLIEDRPLRIAMGRAGRQIVEAEYSVDAAATKYATVFRSVAVGNGYQG
jgi:glycosyltransferase involved in cell wall biosynthesis